MAISDDFSFDGGQVSDRKTLRRCDIQSPLARLWLNGKKRDTSYTDWHDVRIVSTALATELRLHCMPYVCEQEAVKSGHPYEAYWFVWDGECGRFAVRVKSGVLSVFEGREHRYPASTGRWVTSEDVVVGEAVVECDLGHPNLVEILRKSLVIDSEIDVSSEIEGIAEFDLDGELGFT